MQQEDAALAFGQILTECDAFIMSVARLARGERFFLHKAFDNAVLAEAAEEFGMGKGAVVEAHQMLQLVRQYPADFQLHARLVARHHRNALVAAERQQRAVGHEMQQLGIIRHHDGLDIVPAQDIAAKGFEPGSGANIDPLARLGLEFEALGFGKILFRRHRGEASARD